MKVMFALIVALISFNVAAGIDHLKSVPASKYDLGKLQLELVAFVLSDKLEGERVGKTNFKINKFNVVVQGNELLLVSNLVGRAKEISEKQCTTIQSQLSQNPLFSNLPKNIWPGMTENEYKELAEEVKLSVKLISKENSNFIVQC